MCYAILCVFKRSECRQAGWQAGRTCRTRFMTGWQTKCLRFGQSSRSNARVREHAEMLANFGAAKSCCQCVRDEKLGQVKVNPGVGWHAAMLSTFCAALQFSTQPLPHPFAARRISFPHFFHSFAVFAHEESAAKNQKRKPRRRTRNRKSEVLHSI